MTFKEYNQGQSSILPPSFADFLGESHEAVILNEFLNDLDASKLVNSYNNEFGGASAYHPIMLLKVLLYAYLMGVFSSRKIAANLKQDLGFMYLSGNSKPDFRTLARFRKEKGECFEDIFVNVVAKARKLGFVNFGTCSLDGTKLKADACKGNNYTPKELKEKIQGYIKQAEEIDEMEDDLYGDNEDDIDPDLKTKEGRKKKKEEIEKKQKRAEFRLNKIKLIKQKKKDGKINTTDPDSKKMKMKQGNFANGYNVQAVTENGVILTSSIGNGSADQNTLIPTLSKLQKEQCKLPNKVLADKGYSTADNYSYCEKKGIDAYIPIHLNQVDLSDYSYNKKDNVYQDKQRRKYRFKQFMKKIDKKVKLNKEASFREKQKHYKTAIYEYINRKTKKKKYLSVSLCWQEHVKKQEEKLSTPEGKQIYRQRAYDVEGVFGNIKRNLRFRSFNLRGFKGVNAEWMLISLAHNFKKIAYI
jgi:transposase